MDHVNIVLLCNLDNLVNLQVGLDRSVLALCANGIGLVRLCWLVSACRLANVVCLGRTLAVHGEPVLMAVYGDSLEREFVCLIPLASSQAVEVSGGLPS